MRIVDAGWISAVGLMVRFASTYGTEYFHQLYAGRTLIGVTNAPSDRVVLGELQASHYPQPLQLVAVTPDDRLTDFGPSLPPRPYNRVKLGWTTSGWTDAERIEISAGTVAGGAVDLTNVLEKMHFDENRVYSYTTPPMPGSGTWNFQVAGRDDTEPLGNRGTALAIPCGITAHPPDVALADDGTRLAVQVAAGIATVSFTYDW